VANPGTISVPTTDGYYELTVFVRDQAGNTSEQTSRITLRDHTAPVVSNITIPFTLTGGAATTFTAAAGDNLDVGTAQARLVYDGLQANTGLTNELWFGAPTPYGTYGFDEFTTTVSLSETIPFVRSVHVTDGAGNYTTTNFPTTSVRFLVRDIAGNLSTQQNAFAVGTVATSDGVANLTGANWFRVDGPAAAQNVNSTRTGAQGGAPVCPAGTPSSRTVRATVHGATGTFNNPFNSVQFYWIDGSGNPRLLANASLPTDSDDDGTRRIWWWTASFDATGLPAQGNVQVFAVGVDSNGDALITNANTNLSICNQS
jgi:hypothetical protein